MRRGGDPSELYVPSLSSAAAESCAASPVMPAPEAGAASSAPSPTTCGSEETAERLNALYAAYYPRILRYARRFADAASADDVAQDVFLRLMLYKDNDLHRVSLAFLLTMTRNVALRMLERRRRDDRPAGEALPALAPPSDDESGRGTVTEWLRRLSERQSEVVMLTEAKGLSEQQAARSLRMSRSAISARRRDAINHLRAAGAAQVEHKPPRTRLRSCG